MLVLVTSLPVTRVVAYKHGVGFVERHGKFSGTEPIRLTLKRQEMDDLLKSLTVRDLGGGRVTGVSYETGEDIASILAERAIQVPDREALVGLLRLLKGYRVGFTTPSGHVEGEIIGTDESDAERDEHGEVLRTVPKVMLRTEGGVLRPVVIRDISALSILDAQVSQDLDFYLSVVTSERKKNARAITLFLDGEQHDLSVSYIVQMPPWRVSYRLAYEHGEALLQAWGIFDNQLDEDLRDIRLSLVSGKPISFIYDLYTPREVRRPVVREEPRTVERPVELESLELEPPKAPQKETAEFEGDVMTSIEAEPKPTSLTATTAQVMSKSVAPAAQAVEMGEFFRYDVGAPMSVNRGQSAMVPLLQETVPCEKEHVYSGQKVTGNSVVTLRFKNTTGTVLERGPVVVLDEGTYVGEAILPYTPAAGESRLAYAVDLGVTVSEEEQSESVIRGVYLDQRSLRVESIVRFTKSYTAQNKTREPVSLILEHPRRGGCTLVDTPPPKGETYSNYSFGLELNAHSRNVLDVTEEMVRESFEQITSFPAKRLEEFLREGVLKKGSWTKVKALWDLYQTKASQEQAVKGLEAEQKAITEEQRRVRENMSILRDVGEEKNLRARYIKKLEGHEDRLEGIREEIGRAKDTIRNLEMDIANAWDRATAEIVR